MIMPLNVRIFNKNTFHSDWKEGQLVKFYPIGQIPLDAKFCEIDEYESIKIFFESGDHDDRLYIDHFIEDVQKTLKPGDSEIVITTDHSSSMPSPAYYSLRIEGPSGMWESLYLINSKHMDLAYIHSLRLYLEERVNGITYDLIRRRSGMWVPEVGNGQYWFNVYRNIWEKLGVIRRQVELILQEPLDDIRRQYQRQMTSIHPDQKSQRWQNQKGLSKNPSPHMQIQFYEKRTVLTVDTPENQWLAWFLRYLQRNLKDIGLRFSLWENAKQAELSESILKYEKLKEELETNENMYYQTAFKKRNTDLRYQITEADKNVQRLSSELQKFTGNKQELNRMLAWLSKNIHLSWLAQVKQIQGGVAPVLRLRKDPRYSALYRVFMQLRDNMKQDKSTKKNTYPYLGTAKLMEVYTVCLVAELLQGSGWEWKNGWVAGFGQELPTFCELHSGETLTFERRGYQIELAYDKKIPKHANENHVGFEAIVNDRPDIMLTLFNSNGVFVKSLVIEVKHRNHAYLIHPQAKDQSTDVIEQLKGYTRIYYHCPHTKRVVREAVDRVICIYPKQDRGKAYESKYGNFIHLVQIQPTSLAEQTIYGLDILQDQINQFLEQYSSSLTREDIARV